jgi:hypothetical protein
VGHAPHQYRPSAQWQRRQDQRENLTLDSRAEKKNRLLKQGTTLLTETVDVVAGLALILDHGLDLPVEESAQDSASSLDRKPTEDERSHIISVARPGVGRDRRSGAAVANIAGNPAHHIVLLKLEITSCLEHHGVAMVSLM